jgi:hypothetical protein
MKLDRFLLALIAFGGLVAGYPPYHPAAAKAVAKQAASLPASQRGSVGGPATKAGGINGTVKPKH